jgi:hypothetical protein
MVLGVREAHSLLPLRFSALYINGSMFSSRSLDVERTYLIFDFLDTCQEDVLIISVMKREKKGT